MSTEENRTEKISVVLPPSVLRELDAYAEAHRWTRSTAALSMIERGLATERNIPAGLAAHEATEDIYRRATEGIPRHREDQEGH